MSDPFNLERFVTAQEPVFDTVLEELKAARKRTHWMWFIFPQLRDLGRSATAKFYGISSLEEAQAYLGHPLLGPRLILCARTVLESERAVAVCDIRLPGRFEVPLVDDPVRGGRHLGGGSRIRNGDRSLVRRRARREDALSHRTDSRRKQAPRQS